MYRLLMTLSEKEKKKRKEKNVWYNGSRARVRENILFSDTKLHGGRSGIGLVFKKRPAEDAKALNTDAVRVDKDLFKVGVATRYLFCTSPLE